MEAAVLTQSNFPGALRYGRHFCLLSPAVLLLAVADPWRALGAVGSAGLYGAVHAALLVFCLRGSNTLVRKLVFIAAAAGLAFGGLLSAVNLSRFAAAFPPAAKPVVLLALVSAVGAFSYALLVRRLWIATLPLRALAWMTLGCAAATTIAFTVLPSALAFHGLWLAAAWWFAFSAGLRFFDGAAIHLASRSGR